MQKVNLTQNLVQWKTGNIVVTLITCLFVKSMCFEIRGVSLLFPSLVPQRLNNTFTIYTYIQ